MAEPKLRFKKDDGKDFPKWNASTVNNIFHFITEVNKDNLITNVITNSAEYGLISQSDFFDKDIANKDNLFRYTVIKNSDFVYNPRKSKNAPFGPFNYYKGREIGIVSPLYTCLRLKEIEIDKDYLMYYFLTSRWHRYIYYNGSQGGARHDRVGMTNDLMKNLPLSIPSLEEQQKIASFFSNLDEIIAQSEAEVESLEKLKKGAMQKIFSQEVRFKKDDGSDYPEWEKQRFGDYIQTFNRHTSDKKKYPLYSLTIEKGVIPKIDRYEREFLVRKETDAYKIVPPNAFVYNPMNLRFGAVKANHSGKEVSVSSYYDIFSMGSKDTLPFWENYLVSHSMIGWYNAIAAGSLVEKKRVHFSQFINIVKFIPSLEEQQKIADFLSSFDTAIDLAKQELEKWKLLKKGFMQQMFV